MSARAAVAVALALAGCSASPTRIVVVADSDLAVPAEIDAVRIEIDARAIGGDLDVREAALGGSVSLRVVLSVVHDGGSLGPIVVRAEALRDRDPVVVRDARVSFVAGRSIVLRLDLSRACAGVACEQGESCVAGECAPIDVDAETLPEWTGRGSIPWSADAGIAEDATPPRDAGPRDAGPRDAGPRDAGPPVDAGIVCEPSGCECAQDCVGDLGCGCLAGCACWLACVDEVACTHVLCDGSATSCTVDATGAGSLEARCDHGADCTFDARGAIAANGMSCRGSSSCTADCTGAGSCHLKCESESDCLLRCDPGSSSCDVDCSGWSLDCGDGVVACNRACP